MSEFLASNDWQWRLLRTIVQGVLGMSLCSMPMPMTACGRVPS